MNRFLATAVALATLLVVTAQASAAAPPQGWTTKYEVVSVTGSQSFAGTSTVSGEGVASESYTETTSTKFSNSRTGQRVWGSPLGIPLKGTASTSMISVSSCKASLNFATFGGPYLAGETPPAGIQLRVFIERKSNTRARVLARFRYDAPLMEKRFCGNPSIFDAPLSWETEVKVFGSTTMSYQDLRKDNVTIQLQGSSPGWITQSLTGSPNYTGSDKYRWNLKVVLKKTNVDAPG